MGVCPSRDRRRVTTLVGAARSVVTTYSGAAHGRLALLLRAPHHHAATQTHAAHVHILDPRSLPKLYHVCHWVALVEGRDALGQEAARLRPLARYGSA